MFAARRVFQRTLGRRNMSIWESGNDVKTLRKKYYENHTQGAADPTYLKEPSDKIVFGMMVGMTFLGTASIMSGLYSMSFGVNKVP